MAEIPWFEPPAEKVPKAVRAGIDFLRATYGIRDDQMTLILGVQSYRDLVEHLWRVAMGAGYAPVADQMRQAVGVNLLTEFLGVKIVCDPTRLQFVCVVPPPDKCFMYFTDGSLTPQML